MNEARLFWVLRTVCGRVNGRDTDQGGRVVAAICHSVDVGDEAAGRRVDVDSRIGILKGRILDQAQRIGVAFPSGVGNNGLAVQRLRNPRSCRSIGMQVTREPVYCLCLNM